MRSMNPTAWRTLTFAGLVALVSCNNSQHGEQQPAPSTTVSARAGANASASAASSQRVTAASAPRNAAMATLVTMHLVSAPAAVMPDAAMNSTFTVTIDSPTKGVSTLGPFDWPCDAIISNGMLECMFGASYERVRVEQAGDECTIVADAYGENSAEKKSVRTFGTFACHGSMIIRAEQATK